MKNRLQQIEKTGAERFFVLRQLFYHFNLLILCKLEQNNPKSDC